MDKLRMKHAARLTRVVQGAVDRDRITLFSVMKNERQVLPAFLDHYRGLGFEQFLIVDDRSSDDTRAYLARQPDCVIMEADRTFGEEIRYTDPEGTTKRIRFGTWLKIVVPHLFFDGQVVAYFDADEFLLLPPGVISIRELIAGMAARGETALMASMPEFFPRDASGLSGSMPQTSAGMFAAYPWFQPEALFRPGPFEKKPDFLAPPKTEALFARYGVEVPLDKRRWRDRLWMSSKDRAAQQAQTSARHKTPLVLRSAESYLTGSHSANHPAATDRLLTIAHFVFTADFADKVARARQWQSYAHGSRKYHGYAMMMDAMEGVEDGFLDLDSRAYADPRQMLECGLMVWPEAAE